MLLLTNLEQSQSFIYENGVKRPLRAYLGGPMRGHENFNFPAFHYAAAILRSEGYEVFSPAEKGEEVLCTNDPSLQNDLAFRRKVFELDFTYICRHADAVFLLRGWEASSGARAERAAAEAIGLPVVVLSDKYNVKPITLQHVDEVHYAADRR